MRKSIGYLLVALASFCLVGAAVFRFHGSNSADRTSLDLNLTSYAAGSGQVLDLKTGTSPSTTVTEITRVQTDSDASTSTMMVANVGTCLVRGTRSTCSLGAPFVAASTERVAINRKSAEPVAGHGSQLNDQPLTPSGLTFKFPVHTGKHAYQVWDPMIASSAPATYAGTQTVSGLTTYRFAVRVPSTPTSLVTGAPVNYTSDSTLWVEPRTGLVLKTAQTWRETGANGAAVTALTLASTPASVAAQAHTARHRLAVISRVTGWVPLTLLIVGLLLAIGAVVALARRTRRRDDPAAHEVRREPVPA